MALETVAVPEVERVLCAGCKGGGKCPGCAGKGNVKKSFFSRAKVECGSCSGSRACPTCHGGGSVEWPDAGWLSDPDRAEQTAKLHAVLERLHHRLGPEDPRLLSWDSFSRVASRRTFAFDSHDWLEKKEREILAYREYMLFEEIRRDFYRKFRDELVEVGEHVHIEDIVRDAGAGRLPVEFLTVVESRLQELEGAGELVSVFLFKPEELKVDGKPLFPVIPEQGAAELVAAIVDKTTMRRLLVRTSARGFEAPGSR